MLKSLWTDTVKKPSFLPLDHDETTDVLIIGGGIAGILCAHFLHKAGIKYLLCESDTIGGGTTAKTTAVISAQHDALYGYLMKKFGYTKARLYLEANLHAVSAYKKLCRDIDCDFAEIPACIYSCQNAALMENEVKALHGLGFDARLKKEIPLPLPVLAAVEFPNQAQFHPLKFLFSLAENLNIREHTRILQLEPHAAMTERFRIQAKKIIVTSHFPFLNTHGLYFAKLYQKRSYVIALKDAATVPGSYVDYSKSGLYFRSYQNMLLVGGGDHRTGKAPCSYAPLRSFANIHYPECPELYAWATQDCISLDGVPYIGPYSSSLPDVYTATGFNEWGMTSSMAAAEILTDMVLERDNKYAGVFSPARSMLSRQLFLNIGSSLCGLLTPSKMRCPHLGCALKWNACEHTWDCPCHGSRFTEDGRLLYNPATDDLPIAGLPEKDA